MDSSSARHLVMGLAGPELDAEEIAVLRRAAPAGVILFARNIVDLDQVTALVARIRAVAGRPTTIWIDQEGGRVQRIREPFMRHPPAALFAGVEQQRPDALPELLQMSGWVCGYELASIGVGVNCAPVLDVPVAGSDPVIGDRAFGQNPESVIRLARLWMAGLQHAGVCAVGKHFPGHGSATADSHKALPVVWKDIMTLGQWDLLPFQRMLEELPAIMTAHLIATGLDPERPATCSPATLRGLLRDTWQYDGLVVSDALEMQALEGTMAERAERALLAGCDLVLCCTGQIGDTHATLEGITAAVRTMRSTQHEGDPAWKQHQQSVQRIEYRLEPFQRPPGDWRARLQDPWYREQRHRLEQEWSRWAGAISLQEDPTAGAWETLTSG